MNGATHAALRASAQVHGQLKRSFNLIHQSMQNGNYQVFPMFDQAQRAYDAYHEGPRMNCGSLVYNGVERLFSRITNIASAALSRQVWDQRTISTDGSAGPHLLTSGTGPTDVAAACWVAQKSLEYPGMTDQQRFYGHFFRAMSYADMGDFMAELHTVVPEPERSNILAMVTPSGADIPSMYKNAAQDAFYAAHVAGVAGANIPQNHVDMMNSLRAQMCAKVGEDAEEHFAQMHRAGLARFQLPILGLWEGDPTLYEFWGPDRMTLMALHRQYLNSVGPIGSALVDEFDQHNLRWNYDENGRIVLDDTDEARIYPIWVVPDDTRAGLQAAGLSDDNFDMARR